MKQGTAGFTLIELMVALAIGGILTGIAIPNFEQMREIYRLRGATQEVFVALQRARMSAVKENNQYRFYLVGNAYVLHNDLDSDGIEDAGEPKTQTNIQANAIGVTLSGMASASALTFRQNGTAIIAGGLGTITVTNTSEDQKTIVVSPAGRIRIN